MMPPRSLESLDDLLALEVLSCMPPPELARAAQLGRRWRDLSREDGAWHRLTQLYYNIEAPRIGLPPWRVHRCCRLFEMPPTVRRRGLRGCASSKYARHVMGVGYLDHAVYPHELQARSIYDVYKDDSIRPGSKPVDFSDLILHLAVYRREGAGWQVLAERPMDDLDKDLWTRTEFGPPGCESQGIPLWTGVKLTGRVLKCNTPDSDDSESEEGAVPVPLLADLRTRLMLQRRSDRRALTLFDCVHSDWDSFEGMGSDVWHGIVCEAVCLPLEQCSRRCDSLTLTLSIALHPVDASLASDSTFFVGEHPDARLQAALRTVHVGLGTDEEPTNEAVLRFLKRLDWH